MGQAQGQQFGRRPMGVNSVGNDYDQDFWYAVPEKSRRKKRRRIPWIPALLLLVAVFFLFSYGGYRFAEWWLLRGSALTAQTPTEEGEAVQPGKDRMNLLLLGVDQRGDEPARSDTIIVAFMDLKKPDMKLLSIPRDTRVNIPGHGTQKLNHAHAYGGPELTMEVVSDLLGVNIDGYVEVNFQGFEKIIDALGGVEMEVEKRMLYKAEGIDLKPGLQRLNGHDALGYVRYRSDGDDTTRIKRQQKFLKELAEEVVQLSTIWKIPELVTKVNESVKTDLTTSQMLSMAKAMAKLDTSKIEGAMLPGTPKYIGGISYWLADEEELAQLVDVYTGKVQPEPEASASMTSDASR